MLDIARQPHLTYPNGIMTNGHCKTHAIWHLDHLPQRLLEGSVVKHFETTHLDSWLTKSPNPQIHCTCPQALNAMKASLKTPAAQHAIQFWETGMPTPRLNVSTSDGRALSAQRFGRWFLVLPFPPQGGANPLNKICPAEMANEMQRFRNKHATSFMSWMNIGKSNPKRTSLSGLYFSLWLLIFFNPGGRVDPYASLSTD